MKTFVLGCLGVSILSICVCLCLLILTLRAEMTGTRAALVEKVDQVRIDSFAEIDAQANGIRKDTLVALNQQSVLIRKDLADGLKALNHTVSEPLDHITVTLQDAVNKADKRLASLDDHIAPVLENASALTVASTRLVDNYAALPGQLSTELRPSWLAIQPEITCRQADGSGYGGCWHSRITGLMGEAVNVGGTFTKHFPSLVSSFDGIGVDTHKFTTKFTAPTSVKTKIWEGFRGVGAIASHF